MKPKSSRFLLLWAIFAISLSQGCAWFRDDEEIEPVYDYPNHVNTCSPMIGTGFADRMEKTVDFHTKLQNVGDQTAKNVVVTELWYFHFGTDSPPRVVHTTPCSLSPAGHLAPGEVTEVTCPPPPKDVLGDTSLVPKLSIECESYSKTENGQTDVERELTFTCTPQKGWYIRLTEPGPSPPAHTVDRAHIDYQVTFYFEDQLVSAGYSSEVHMTWPVAYQDDGTTAYRYYQQTHKRSGGSLASTFVEADWFTMVVEDDTLVAKNDTGTWVESEVTRTGNLIGYLNRETQELFLCDHGGTVPDPSGWIKGGPENFRNSCLIDLYVCNVKK